MKNLLIILLIILVLVYCYMNYKSEHLFYTENKWLSLEDQEKELKRLDDQYYNSVPEEDVITNDYNERDNLAYMLALTT
jgi:hypothetical protein